VTEEYGIVANSMEADRAFRLGAKAWLVGGTGGEGWNRFEWVAMTRGGRRVRKWAPTVRFGNFRAAWIIPELQNEFLYMSGSREEMEELAVNLNNHADDLRAKMVNRRPSYQASFESDFSD
jgi:hypothetical protein